MSLLGKLFGGRSLEEERAHADALFERGDFGAAKLSYERAASQGKGKPELQAELRKRGEDCQDAIAKQHLDEANRLAQEGNLELAFDALRQVELTAADPALQRRAREGRGCNYHRSRLHAFPPSLARSTVEHSASRSGECCARSRVLDRVALCSGTDHSRTRPVWRNVMLTCVANPARRANHRNRVKPRDQK